MKKINIVFITLILFFTILLTSCELFLSEPDDNEGRIILVGVGLNYSDVTSLSTLRGTLNDVKLFSYAIQTLSEQEKKNFYWIPITDEVDSDSLNYATEDNIKNTITYLKDGLGDKPLIIKNPKHFDLNDSYVAYKESGILMDDAIILNSKDILIFQYSGHGTNDNGVLLLRSTNNLNSASTFELKDVYNLFRNLPCKSLILLDSCYSGNLIPISDTTISTNDPRVDENWFVDYFGFLLDDSSNLNSSFDVDDNIFILTATTSDKQSFESEVGKKWVGIFTHSLLKSLGWDINSSNSDSIGFQKGTIPAMKNGLISVDNIYEYVSNISHNKRYYDARVIGGRYDLVLFDL